jgi:hypothetical protein
MSETKMQAQNPFRSVLMGNGTLLVQCAEALLARGNTVIGVVTENPEIAGWAEGRGLRVIAPTPRKTLAQRIGSDPFEWAVQHRQPVHHPGRRAGAVGARGPSTSTTARCRATPA